MFQCHKLRSVIVAITAVLVAGCNPGGAQQPGADSPAPAERIISLAPNLTEILYALDLGSKIVGVTNHCNYPPEALDQPKVGGFVNPDLETVVGLEPDLVIATPNVGNKDTVLRLESFGVEFLIVDPDDFAGLFETIRTIGIRTATTARAEQLVQHLEHEIAAVRARVESFPARGAFIVFSREPLIVAGPGTFFDELLTTAGGRNLAAGADAQFPQFSLEEFVRLGPEAIIDTTMGSNAGARRDFWDRWDSLPAVRDERICSPPPDVITRPGPRLTEGLSLLAQCLHPHTPREPDSPESVTP